MATQPGRLATRLFRVDLDLAIDRAIERLGGVGIGVAVVANDEPVLVAGYGVREHGGAAPYSATTVQNVGSISKVVATDTIAALVTDGLVAWDDPLVDHVPWFRLADPWATADLTIRDIPAYRIGTDLPPLGYYFFDAASCAEGTRRGHVRRLRFLRPRRPLRATHAYGNELFAVLGQLVEETTGLTWEAFLDGRLLAPLNMTATTGDYRAYEGASDQAAYHQRVGERTVRIPTEHSAVEGPGFGPAGGVHTCAADMAQWLRLHLGGGSVGGGRILGAEVVDEEHALHTAYRGRSPRAAPLPGIVDTTVAGDALGWHSHTYRGEFLLYKTGGNPGIRALVALLPARGLGVHVQSNTDGCAFLPWAVAYTVLDHLLGAEPFDWVEHFAAHTPLPDRALPLPPRPGGHPPALPEPARLVGCYSADGAYAWPGEITASQTGMRFNLGAFAWDLHPWDADRCLMENVTPFLGPNYNSGAESTLGPIFARFVGDPDGRVTRMVVEDAEDQIVFRRVDEVVHGGQR